MKLFLCGMTNAGNEKNLREMIEPILEYFDGLVWTFHHSTETEYIDNGYLFLKQNKKEGAIIDAKWVQRHDYSMNRYLYEGPMQDGDYFVQLDSTERLGVEFAKNLRNVCESMEKQNIGMMSNFGKGLIFRYNEMLEFRNSPHWTIINTTGMRVNTELDKSEFWNVRDEQREPFAWIDHYAKYMLYPAGSNHALLGIEHRGKPEELFPIRELARLEFLKEIKKRGYSRNIEGLKRMMVESFDDKLKELINTDKVWVDFYRYHILGETDLIDEHTWESKKDLK